MSFQRAGRSLTSWLLPTVLTAPFLAGCVTTRERESPVAPQVAHAYLADKPSDLRDDFYITLSQGQRNKVLNDVRLGLATMEEERYDLAEQLFDEALLNIEAVYANNDQAKEARQLFVKETVKDFKGEPYERVMAYFYRGLLYMRVGDYENARASFKGGMLQDAFAEEDQYRADFSLMPYLQAWAAKCSGNASAADEDMKEFREINELTPLPEATDNVLVLVEAGSAPRKYGATDPNQTKPRYLKFSRDRGNTRAVLIRAEPTTGLERQMPEPIHAAVIESIYRQASTRGGREFDSILAGKAQFKGAANAVGDVALIGAGAAASLAARRNDRDAAVAAGVLLLVALAAKSASAATEPNADTRYWDNLPDRIYGAALNLSQSVDAVRVDFQNADGSTLSSKTANIWRTGDCGFAWVRENSAHPALPRAPNSVPPDLMYEAVVIPPLPIATPQQKNEVAESQPADAERSPEDVMFDNLKSGFMKLFKTTPATAKSESQAPPASAMSNSTTE